MPAPSQADGVMSIEVAVSQEAGMQVVPAG
jgi:hypothetical protein